MNERMKNRLIFRPFDESRDNEMIDKWVQYDPEGKHNISYTFYWSDYSFDLNYVHKKNNETAQVVDLIVMVEQEVADNVYEQIPIGAILLDIFNDEMKVAYYYVKRTWQNKGVGTELIRLAIEEPEKLGITAQYSKIVAWLYAANGKSKRVFENHGFSIIPLSDKNIKVERELERVKPEVSNNPQENQ